MTKAKLTPEIHSGPTTRNKSKLLLQNGSHSNNNENLSTQQKAKRKQTPASDIRSPIVDTTNFYEKKRKSQRGITLTYYMDPI
jgi:hypothetical protein